MSVTASPDLLVVRSEALHEQLLSQRAFGLWSEPVASYTARNLAEAALVRLRARGRLQWRPTAPCPCCGHEAQLLAPGSWSCIVLTCCCVRSGGCKVEALPAPAAVAGG